MEYIYVPGFGRLRTCQMQYFRADTGYTYVHLQFGRPLLTAKGLMYYERELPRFIRASRQYLLNPDYIISIERNSSRQMFITMRDLTRIEVSRRNIHFVNKILTLRDVYETSAYSFPFQNLPAGRTGATD